MLNKKASKHTPNVLIPKFLPGVRYIYIYIYIYREREREREKETFILFFLYIYIHIEKERKGHRDIENMDKQIDT